MKIRKLMYILFSFCLIVSLLPNPSFAAYTEEDLIEVEAAPKDVTIDTKGPLKQINYLDKSIEGKADFLSLFTEEYASEILVKKNWVAVQVDQTNKVVRVVNQSANGAPPVWEDEQYLEIPESGYVLLAHDDSWATKDFRKYLATNFKPGDIIKLRKNGEVVPVTEFMTGEGLQAGIVLNNQKMYTVNEPQTEITGSIRNYEADESYRLLVNGQETALAADGTFKHVYELAQGTNYIDLEIYKNNSKHEGQSLIVYYKKAQVEEKEVFLWIEQGPSARRFQSSEDIYQMLVEAKDAGVTSIALDVKGVEGFAAYQKNDLTGRPYVSEMTSPSRAGSNPNIDLLEEFIKHSHQLGLTVHAAINVFAEGSIAHNEFAVLNDHLDWEEKVYRHEDGGEILRLRDSKYGKSGALVAFVNPANPEVRDYQLKTFEEVIKNYDVDGVLLDRGRYDNFFADFSDESKSQFEAYLAEQGKELKNWPEDIFTYEGSNRVDGPLINDWYTYRSNVIKSFTSEVRELVDSYNENENRDVLLSSYVGSWFETYYLNGVNWSSPSFEYNERLEFPQENLYTEEYAQAGYTDNLDFLMIGTYQTTAKEIEKYITQGNILTNGELPLYAGMALSNIQDPAVQREVFQSGMRNTNGLMLFDYSQANFPVIKASIEDVEYVKDYQLGISDPRDPYRSIAGDFLNINRNDANINVYTNTFGPSTSTSKWGVEAVVDASGNVIKMVNKKQAANWNWANVEDNNSLIPEGGFVISSQDVSGVREKRQLVANAFDIGDSVRASLLRGFLDYEGQTFNRRYLDFSGNVQVVGPGEATVTVNGSEVQVQENGYFSSMVELQEGLNQVEIIVKVDGYQTHRQVVNLTGADFNDVEALKEMLKRADINPKGIQQSLLAQVEQAQQDFEKSEQLLEQGEEAAAAHFGEKGYQKLLDVQIQIQKHSGRKLNEEDAGKLILLIERIIANRNL
ncbi:family 10 glycosylhydrolase [Neobacillus niacini]|uniref:family 10 glycosylhydrolase n=1 Tax=Neobacillus niacini TaxID=86668 RepID=UPI00187C04D6|nr:family 10 glycosylhydrolase [Neobacillus niacini]